MNRILDLLLTFSLILAVCVSPAPAPAAARPPDQMAARPTDSRTLTASSELATLDLTAGWATFGIALSAGAASEGLALGGLETQTDIKTRWSDHSIRFAVVTAAIPQGGTYTLTAAPAPGGTFTPTLPTASVQLTLDGVDYTAQLPDAPTSDFWLNGALVQEWRAVVTPADSGGEPHPFLRVLFDLRVYRDGQARLDVTVENTLDLAEAGPVTCDVTVQANNETLFQAEQVTQAYLTRWRKVFDLYLTASQITPDIEPYYQAAALPRYLSLVIEGLDPPGGPEYEILQVGSLNPYMPDHGGRAEIAPYPDWTASYLVHRNLRGGRDVVLAHGDLGGSWPIHIREADDGRMVSIDERPNFWLDPRGEERPAGNMTCPRTYDDREIIPDIAHQPSLAYVPYLLTGDRYHADELAFWANYVLLGTFQESFYNARGGSLGLLRPNETRGVGWGLRNITDAAAYLPDAHPLKAYFEEKVL